MHLPTERKVILVTRHTRLEELVQHYHTLAQARFYIEHLGADFSDYQLENEIYARNLCMVTELLQNWGRYQIIDRSLVPNYCFAPDDIIVTLGQDGLVANTFKYLQGQPVIGINPDPARWDGVLLPFMASDFARILAEVAYGRRKSKSITLAQATLSDGQVLRAVNDFFIGPRTHTSALYEIEANRECEVQSSSGIIVSTGLGSTAWIKSIITGSMAIAQAHTSSTTWQYTAIPWDSSQLIFAVREPFPSRSSQARLVYGTVDRNHPLKVRSRMAENGIIFSDGMQQDYMAFNAGVEATITLASDCGQLVV